MHEKNIHQERYDLQKLASTFPQLANFIIENRYGKETIDFFNPEAVKALNQALLKEYYQVENWDIPAGYLCPPIPGRADYIHHVAELLARSNYGKIPKGNHIKGLDVGVGANCIYPIIGTRVHDWSFIGSELDKVAFENAQQVVENNENLKGKIEIRKQHNSRNIFTNIIDKKEPIDFMICNPPFHNSLEEAQAGTQRKIKNLTGETTEEPVLNFGGQGVELWTEGGEKQFIHQMIKESQAIAKTCFVFTTLVSKEKHLKSIYIALKKADVERYQTIEMTQGNKTSRIVAWTYLNRKEQKVWRDARFDMKS